MMTKINISKPEKKIPCISYEFKVHLTQMKSNQICSAVAAEAGLPIDLVRMAAPSMATVANVGRGIGYPGVSDRDTIQSIYRTAFIQELLNNLVENQLIVIGSAEERSTAVRAEVIYCDWMLYRQWMG